MAAHDLFASEENLKALTFDSLASALQHLQIEAKKCGFEIGCNESLRSVYGTFYCLKGGRARGKKTTKTGCEWKLSLGPGEEPGTVKILRGHCLEHNHPLTPDKYSILQISGTEEDLIKRMLDAGIAPRLIQRFLATSGQTDITAAQIASLKGKVSTIQVPQTEELRQYMEEIGGICQRMETRIGGKTMVHGVFTATQFELDNLKQYGHVIWLDGTQRQNRLQWEIMPVTVIDQFKRIRCAGVFFVSRSDQDVIKWILRLLLTNADLLAVLRTIITDEDSAFIPAFDSVMKELNHGRPDDQKITVDHVLCAFHKEQNYLRKVAKAGLTAVQREEAAALFKIVAYVPHKQACEDALVSIEKLSPKLASYVRKHVRPVLGKFARSHLSDVFTKGYNTTSPAESHNNMMKAAMIDGRVYSLKQMRIDISFAHRNAELAWRQRLSSAFTNQHFTATKHGASFSPKIRRDIDLTHDEALELVCTDEGKVFHPDLPTCAFQVKVSGDQISCDCGRVAHAGLICSHIIALQKHKGINYEDGYPIQLIAPIWWIRERSHAMLPVNKDGQIEDDAEEDEEPEAVQEDVFPAGNPLEDPTTEEHAFGPRDVITLLTDKERFSQQKERYLALFHLAKTVASVGSRNREVSLRIHEELQKMLNELFALPETTKGASAVESEAEDDEAPADVDAAPEPEEPEPENVVEVQDCVHRRRGRPKKQQTIAEMFRGRRKCVLCGATHRVQSCSKYDAFASAVEHNLKEVDDAGRRRCSICAGIGHNKKSCPWIHRAKQ